VTQADDTELQLQLASDALNAGDFENSQVLAREALAVAKVIDDLLLQGQALCMLADQDRLLSRYRRAYNTSQRAANLFRTVGDVRGEVAALATAAHAASNLGRNEDAVEAALLSVRLAEKLPPGVHNAMAYNYLGVAYFWSRNWQRAQSAFDEAVKAAKACWPVVCAAQPLLNQCMADLLRLYDGDAENEQIGRACSWTSLARRLEGIIGSEDGPSLSVAAQPTLDCLSRFGLAIVYLSLGEIAQAQRLMETARLFMARAGAKTWMNVFDAWTRAELAWKTGDFATAESAASKMVRIATEVEHEQLACVGQLLLVRVNQAQGKYAQSLAEMHRLRSREQLIRAEAIQSREQAVQWQMDARGSQASLLSLEVTSRQLELLSFQDPLTGLENRRSFEVRVSAILGAQVKGMAPPCAALIDVDQFKLVNDTFSHQVGDKVLRAIAEILAASTRTDDIAARLGGDEFVIAFQRPVDSATQVCARIDSSIRDFDWSGIAPGLRVTVSIGMAQAEPGDSVETLMHRSDLAMYVVKKAAAALRTNPDTAA
jgi:diguanylate cyclase (GGDEF)-like protein